MTHESTHVDLFTGLAGFSLAARANGVRTIAMCEADARCQAFLAKAWPGVPVWPDVRTFDLGIALEAGRSEGKSSAAPAGYGSAVEPDAGERLADALLSGGDNSKEETSTVQDRHWTNGRVHQRSVARQNVWLLTAGVPCQPASRAGKQGGASDDRWLWGEAVKVFAAIRPAWGLFENPPGIGDVGLAGILSDVEAQGYATRVFSVGACALSAPHRRMRYWIVCKRMADGSGFGCRQGGADTRGIRKGKGTPGQWLRPSNGIESQWKNYVWLPCADGKVRRAPSDAFLLADGLRTDLLAELEQTHRSALGALGNSIVHQVAAQIISAMIQSESL